MRSDSLTVPTAPSDPTIDGRWSPLAVVTSIVTQFGSIQVQLEDNSTWATSPKCLETRFRCLRNPDLRCDANRLSAFGYRPEGSGRVFLPAADS